MQHIQQFIKVLAFSSIKITFDFCNRKANTFRLQQHLVSLKDTHV